jgi:hypothetical protein
LDTPDVLEDSDAIMVSNEITNSAKMNMSKNILPIFLIMLMSGILPVCPGEKAMRLFHLLL